MPAKYLFTVFFLPILLVSNTIASPIAEYTGTSNNGLVVSANFVHAMAFDLGSDSIISEFQLNLSRWSGSSGNFNLQLHRDSDGEPASGMVANILVPVTDIPKYEETWVPFQITPMEFTAGRWWLVCKHTSTSEIDWWGVSGNPYNTGDDTKTSTDGGSTWSVLQGIDVGFKVFGQIVPENTTIVVTATPASVAIDGVTAISVTVNDSGSLPIGGTTTIAMSASDGTLGGTSLELKDGQATTTWTAPADIGSETITATYSGHTYGGSQYQPSNNNTSVNVVAEQRSTTTSQALSTPSTSTFSNVNISVTVVDNSETPVIVTGGKVTFTCSEGSFSPNPATVSAGSASTTWTASSNTGSFDIKACYSGYDTGTTIFGASDDTDSISVDYTNIATNTTVKVSPNYPYINGKAYVIVTVKEGSSNVPGGTVQLSAPSGSFDSTTLTLTSGKAHTIWHCPGASGDVSITGTYQQYIGGGKRYLTSNDSTNAHVTADTDSTGTGLRARGEWNTDYSTNPLKNTGNDCKGFTGKLSDHGWSKVHAFNSTAWEEDMKKSSKGGRENDFMDVADFTYYSGHGNPDYITFINNFDDKKLKHSDAYDAWGTKDAEWVVFSACNVMSKHSYWASTMKNMHLECGWHTVMSDSATFGGIFADLLTKDSVDDEPHTIKQAFFLAGDMTHPNDRKQRVIAETYSMFSDYIWGQGYVNPDPSDDDYYSEIAHDVASANPVADAGGGYVATAGVPIQLDASLTTDADSTTLWYAWDMDIFTSSDPCDWDNDGIDETNDDADVWGRRPWYTFPTAGPPFAIQLLVIDHTYNRDTAIANVQVLNPPPAPSPPAGSSIQFFANGEPEEPIEIVEDFISVPPEVQMPTFTMADTALGYNEMMNVAGYYSMEGASQLDQTGNWTMTHGTNKTIINKNTGAVMYVDMLRSYNFNPGPPPILPSDIAAKGIADSFLASNGISTDLIYGYNVSEISANLDSIGKGQFSIGQKMPFQKRVNYQRGLSVMEQTYPVVGPGGKIIVMVDEYGDTRYFVKIWRQLEQAEDVMLSGANLAIQKFHELGPAALIGGSKVPPCSRIEIDNVSLGYYEADFVTNQTTVLPVYILDLTCEDETASHQVQVYLPASGAPIEPIIDSPPPSTTIDLGDPVTFSGSASGGTGPYAYTWTSDIDGLLSNDPCFVTSSLSVNTRGQDCTCNVLPHTITLTVSDPNSFEASTSIELTVQGYCGDFDDENDVKLDDFAQLASSWQCELGEADYDIKFDLNQDGYIEPKDLCIFANEWLMP